MNRDTNDSEAWMACPGWEGLYSVSSHGRVRSEQRIVKYACGKSQTVRQRVMSPAKKKSGHLSVMFYRGSCATRLHVHRLVATCFIGPQPSPLHEVAHNDGNPGNNSASNLRWSTRSENHRDKVSHGTHNRGQRHPLARLSDAQVADIRASGLSNADVALAYSVTAKHVWAIRAHKAREYQ